MKHLTSTAILSVLIFTGALVSTAAAQSIPDNAKETRGEKILNGIGLGKIDNKRLQPPFHDPLTKPHTMPNRDDSIPERNKLPDFNDMKRQRDLLDKKPTIDIVVEPRPVEPVTEIGPSPHLHSMTLEAERMGAMTENSSIRNRTFTGFFDGFIYPRDVRDRPNTSRWDADTGALVPFSYQHGGFYLDSPLVSMTDTSQEYYAFGLALKHQTGKQLEVTFANDAVGLTGESRKRPTRGTTVTDAQNVSGPNCDDPQKYQMMHQLSFRSTGVRSWAAYNTRISDTLDSGQPVFWESCRSTSSADTDNKSHIVILVPKDIVGPGVDLEIRTANQTNIDFGSQLQQQIGSRKDLSLNRSSVSRAPKFGDQRLPQKRPAKPPKTREVSPKLYMHLTPSPPMMAVLGDSLAWGQGLLDEQKFSHLVADRLHPNMDISVFAHSGAKSVTAVIEAGPGRLLSRRNTEVSRDFYNGNCEVNRETYGEVPRAHPSTACQIGHSSEMICTVADGTRRNTENMKFQCSKNTPNLNEVQGFHDGFQRISGPDSFKIDIRSRYDYALISSCLNDLQATAILWGMDDETSLGQLADEARKRCDLRNGLKNIRQFYPNAMVVFSDPHLFFTDDTLLNFCYSPGPTTDAEVSARLTLGFALARFVTGAINTGFSPLDGLSVRSDEELLEFATDTMEETRRLVDEISASVSDIGEALTDPDLSLPPSNRLVHFRNIMRDVRLGNISPRNPENLNSDTHGGRGAISLSRTNWVASDGMFGNSHKSFGLDCDGADLTNLLSNLDNPVGLYVAFSQLTSEVSLDSVRPEGSDDVGAARWAACGGYAYGGAVHDPGFMCRLGPTFHPNEAGAQRMADAIVERVTDANGSPEGNSLPAGGTNIRPQGRRQR